MSLSHLENLKYAQQTCACFRSPALQFSQLRILLTSGPPKVAYSFHSGFKLNVISSHNPSWPYDLRVCIHLSQARRQRNLDFLWIFLVNMAP